MTITQSKYYDENREADQRKVPDHERKNWTVSALGVQEKYHEITRLLVLGMKNTEIAKRLNVSPQMISNVKNSPIIQERIKILQGARDAETVDIAKEIQEAAPVALDLLTSIIRGDNDGEQATLSLRAKTSESLLDRAGHSPVKKVYSENYSAHLTRDDIEAIKERAKQNRQISETA